MHFTVFSCLKTNLKVKLKLENEYEMEKNVRF